ncbi:hypothetical protein CPAR01_15024 [Colletotrichum paranaense]|uniref:Uncharacterized protein n=3 Tax=Colletotrichum acutatum species complex TaxID=2707335 RepID=A0A9Q0B154_9PEZI|nr:uncharacterized protein CPAR01_15024 [Colletotrichum paranaense]KAI3546980.1 hypothetical protein CABS02_08829 [Colletotrichum abscissum]KAK0372024.1 hypothetical protein CLIM01_10613 [Colletotrichum limetticola]KAK1521501.1 hypothetical protein CPAR01_15024 [Colletotrichum paranaense]
MEVGKRKFDIWSLSRAAHHRPRRAPHARPVQYHPCHPPSSSPGPCHWSWPLGSPVFLSSYSLSLAGALFTLPPPPGLFCSATTATLPPYFPPAYSAPANHAENTQSPRLLRCSASTCHLASSSPLPSYS